MKKRFIILIISFLLGCTKNKNLEGFWYSSKITNNEFPKLLKFEGNRLINYTSLYDTLTYTYFENKLFLTNKSNEKYNIKFNLKDSLLTFRNSKSDSLLLKFKKKKANHFLDDLLIDKSLKIDLPTGNGFIKRYDTNLFEPLFINYKDGILTANFKNKTITVDDYFYLFLIQNYSAEKTFTKLQLIADKNIKLKDFEFIKKQLAFANYFNIHLILQHNKYEFIKSFGIKIATNIRHDRPVLKTIPPSFSNQKINDSYINLISPPPSPPAPIIDKEHTLIIKIGKEILYINNKNISKKEFKEIIKKRALTDSFFNISYTYSNNATYQDYINTFDVFFNTIISLRKDYLKNKYDIDYNSLDYKDKEKIQEIKRKFPFVFLHSTENSKHL